MQKNLLTIFFLNFFYYSETFAMHEDDILSTAFSPSKIRTIQQLDMDKENISLPNSLDPNFLSSLCSLTLEEKTQKDKQALPPIHFASPKKQVIPQTKSTTDPLPLKTKSVFSLNNPQTPLFLTPQKQASPLRILADPNPTKPQSKVKIEKPVLSQWIAHNDFVLTLKSSKKGNEIFSYSPLEDHLSLRDIVEKGKSYFPGSENLFAIQLRFFVKVEDNKQIVRKNISYSLTIPHEGRQKKIVFVSGSEKETFSETSYFISLTQIKKMFQKKDEDLLVWHKDTYKTLPTTSQMIEKKTHAQRLNPYFYPQV